MDRWGLDKKNTLRYVTSRAVHEERKKDEALSHHGGIGGP